MFILSSNIFTSFRLDRKTRQRERCCCYRESNSSRAANNDEVPVPVNVSTCPKRCVLKILYCVLSCSSQGRNPNVVMWLKPQFKYCLSKPRLGRSIHHGWSRASAELKKPETSDVTSCSILIQRYLGFWWIAPTRSCYTPNTDRFLYKRTKCSWVNLYVHILRDQQSFLPNRNKFILDRHKPFIIELRGHETPLSWHLNVGVGEETDTLNFTFYVMETYFECQQNYIFK